jgi:hypothetical protein
MKQLQSINLLLVGMLAVILLSNADAAQSRTPAERYGLPTVDSALKISKVTTPIRFPRLIVGVGVSRASVDKPSVNAVLDAVLTTYDVSSGNHVGSPPPGLAGSLRVQFSRRIGLWWDYSGGSEPETDGTAKAATTFGLLLTPLRARSGAIALSLGTGYAYQKLWSRNSYFLPIPNSSGTLERIDLETGKIGGVPLLVMLELPASATSRYSLNLSAKQIFSKKAVLTHYYDQIDSYEIEMSGLYLSATLAVGL